jgi:hypothetical protein
MTDPTKLAALAALVGITPETHPHLVLEYCDDNFPEFGVVGKAMRLPALDTPAGDDVFLAPLMRWCKSHWLKPIIDGSANSWYSWVHLEAGVTDQTMTAALLRACQSAGVPEIVAIFGEAEHG